MTFDDLLIEQIGRQTYESFTRECAELLKKDRDKGVPFLYGLAVSGDFSRNPAFRNSMMHVGGIAVLGHMVSAKGGEVLLKWRGTHDLDIVLIDKPAYSVLGPYIRNSRISNSLCDKISADLGDPEVDNFVNEITTNDLVTSCKVDVYLQRGTSYNEVDIGGYRFKAREESGKARKVNIMGADVVVPDFYTILKMKLGVGIESGRLPEVKHMIDILNLVGVAEAYGHSEADVFAGLETAQLRERLIEVINHLTAETGFHTSGIRTALSTAVTAPTEKYVTKLRALNKELKKRRKV